MVASARRAFGTMRLRAFSSVGFVGAGNMGRGMAASLARSGQSVKQYDRDPASLAASVGQSEQISGAGALRELCSASEPSTVVVSVAGEAAERAVFLGADGIFESAQPGSLVVGCGTVTVAFARELHEAAESKGLRFLDAPVSGGPEGAAKGTLSIMCGGDAGTFDAAKPVLDGMGAYVVRMGGGGAGAAAKLVNQQLTAVNALAATEGLALARAMGMGAEELTALLQLLERSWGNSTMLQRTGNLVAEALKAPDARAALSAPAMAPLRNFAKDLDFVLAAASDASLSMPSTRTARDAVHTAAALNLDTADWAFVSEMHTPDAPTAPPAPLRPAASPALPLSEAKTFATLTELQAGLPDEWHEGERALLLRNGVLAARKGAPLAVIDDDPTGTQTVHSVPVLAEWSVEALAAVLVADVPCFYVLANTRALPPAAATARAETIGSNLRAAAARVGLDHKTLGVVSRGDSTLRGHYPGETDALARGLGWDAPAVLLAPFFLEGKRYTAFDTHYVGAADGSGGLTPCAETEFARDRAFGYSSSHLPTWVAEKTNGKIAAQDVCSLTLHMIRTGGPPAVQAALAALPNGGANAVVVANALTPCDMAVVTLGTMLAERDGFLSHGLIYRSAGALVAARAAIPPRPLLTASELQRTPMAVPKAAEDDAAPRVHAPPQTADGAGLIVVGSYVGKSTEQLAALHELCPWFATVELRVAQLAQGGEAWAAEEARARQAVESALRAEQSVVVHTSREVLQDDGQGGLLIGERVNNAIVSLVRSLAIFPSFLVAKGGITSNDVAVEGLGVKRALVLGSVRPGVPVWRCGPESRAPGLAYVVFPGNVGAKDDLAKVAALMSGRGDLGGDTPAHHGAAVRVAGGGETVPSLLRDARSRGRAVGAFNIYNLEGALAVRRAVEATGLPAILQLHPASMAFGGTALIAACLDVAASCTSAPLLVQLDHAQHEGPIRDALGAGVHGVMADGSHLELEANVAWTTQMARLAHEAGAAVEAELGKLAGEEDGLSVELKDAKMTDPAVVSSFLSATAIDALAVTIGNVHGTYAVHPPELDWARLDAVRMEAGDTPLVLHGASGLPDEMLVRAIRASVCKFNVNTEVRAAARAAVAAKAAEGRDVLEVMGGAMEAMVPVIEAKLRAFAPGR